VGSPRGREPGPDSGGASHIAYVNFVTGALQYASQSATGAWQIDVIDTGPNVGTSARCRSTARTSRTFRTSI